MNNLDIFNNNKRKIHTKRKFAGGNKSSSGSSSSSSGSFDPSTHCSVCYKKFNKNRVAVPNNCCTKSVMKACKKCNKGFNNCMICRKPSFRNSTPLALRRASTPSSAPASRASVSRAPLSRAHREAASRAQREAEQRAQELRANQGKPYRGSRNPRESNRRINSTTSNNRAIL